MGFTVDVLECSETASKGNVSHSLNLVIGFSITDGGLSLLNTTGGFNIRQKCLR